ncbi:MAG: NERD domain-containing protein [Coriobacteriia bacterium]|nr:NERD domain-containing protein [Coriobacteriia bacterium]
MFLFILVIFAILIPPMVWMLIFFLGYRDTIYRRETGAPWFKVRFDKGAHGEYLSFRKLEKVPGHKRFLFNVYLPTDAGGTSEVDLLMIHPMGIFVIESKNYSGWIFGKDTDKMWTQSLENRQKNRFANPVWQNSGHIKHLKANLKSYNDVPYYSYVVFSEKCELKKISVSKENTWVLQRQNLAKAVGATVKQTPLALSLADIGNIYAELNQYAHATAAQKQAHIDAIREKDY